MLLSFLFIYRLICNISIPEKKTDITGKVLAQMVQFFLKFSAKNNIFNDVNEKDVHR